MGKSQYIVGLDIGSATVRSVIAELSHDDGPLKVVGVGTVPSVGIRRGVVVQPEEVAKTINTALESAERMAGASVDQVVCSVSGSDLFAQAAIGVIAVGKADGEVTEDDLTRIVEETQARTVLGPNKEILHVIPQHYRLDDQDGIKDPVGLKGVRLELSSLIIGTGSNHLKNLIRSLELAGIKAQHFIAEPLASAEAILSAKQKELGVVVVNIGANTTSLAVFEDGDLLHLAVLPVGGSHITNDIAIGLRVSIDVAEAVKLQYGHAIPTEISKKEAIDLSEFDSQESDEVSRHHVAEIIEARLEEIFHYVNLELKGINREALLPAGVILTGGGILVPGAVELAKRRLRLPAQVGYPKPLGGILDHVDGPASATVVGLLLSSETSESVGHFSFGGASQLLQRLPGDWGGLTDKARSIFRRFLP